jgi:hypothetical protein
MAPITRYMALFKQGEQVKYILSQPTILSVLIENLLVPSENEDLMNLQTLQNLKLVFHDERSQAIIKMKSKPFEETIRLKQQLKRFTETIRKLFDQMLATHGKKNKINKICNIYDYICKNKDLYDTLKLKDVIIVNLNLLKTQSSKFKKRHYQKYYDCLSN